MSFDKNSIDDYLKVLAKEYKKINGSKVPAEIVIVGGASIIINYGFRDRTYDIDAIYSAGSAMKDAIKSTAEKFALPEDWLNSDFTKTSSYSTSLVEISKYYREFSHILQVRTIRGEYLVAMKLESARPYKHDLSDVIGILNEHVKMNEPLSFEKISKAYEHLYKKSLDYSSDKVKKIKEFIESGNINKEAFEKSVEEEKLARTQLVEFEKEYPNVLNEGNLEEILKNRLNKASTLSNKLSSAKEKTNNQNIEIKKINNKNFNR